MRRSSRSGACATRPTSSRRATTHRSRLAGCRSRPHPTQGRRPRGAAPTPTSTAAGSTRPRRRALGVNPNALRYAALTGTVLIRWDGARQPTVWTVPRPEVDPRRTRRARAPLPARPRSRHAQSFAAWAGVSSRAALAAFDALGPSLVPLRTPVGDAVVLASDEALLRAPAGPAAPARLLPSGDLFYLLQGADRAAPRIPNSAPPSGHPASGRAPSSSMETWPGRGAGRAPSSRPTRGGGSQRRTRRRRGGGRDAAAAGDARRGRCRRQADLRRPAGLGRRPVARQPSAVRQRPEAGTGGRARGERRA